MKKTKTFKIVLAVVMMFALISSTLAGVSATTGYTITIDNATAGHEYGAYQLFAGDIEGGKLTNITWGTGVNDSTQLLAAIKDDITLDTTFDDCTTAEAVADVLADTTDTSIIKAFAKVVGNYFKDSSISPTKTSIDNGDSYTITGLPAGYYLVKDQEKVISDSSTFYILEVAKSINVSPKAGVPTVTKKVLEDSDVSPKYTGFENDTNYNDVADWDIGQVKSFKIYAHLPVEMWDYDTYTLKFTDTFVDGITVVDKVGNALSTGEFTNFKVSYYANGTEKELTTSPFTGIYTPKTGNDPQKLVFTCNDIKSALENVDVTSGEVTVAIEYNAKLNENCVVGLGGNQNKVYLEYSNDPYDLYQDGTSGSDVELGSLGQTAVDKVIVFTFKLQGTKVDGDNNETTLPGAEFKLGRDTDNDGTADEWATLENNILTGWVTDEANATILRSADNTGIFNVIGVDSGTYYLKETKAPEGYNKLADPVKMVVTSKKTEASPYQQNWTDGEPGSAIDKVELTVGTNDPISFDETAASLAFTIENKSGATLPSTGDTGKAIFYAIGAIGFAAAAIILITRKRMAKEKE